MIKTASLNADAGEMNGVLGALRHQRTTLALTLQALLIAGWAVAAYLVARAAAAQITTDFAASRLRFLTMLRERGHDTSSVRPPEVVHVSYLYPALAGGILRMLALVGLAWLLAMSGRRLAAVLLPALVLAAGVVAPLQASLLGPVLLGDRTQLPQNWVLRLGELATLVVVALPALLIARRSGAVPVRQLAPLLAVPAVAAVVWVAIELVSPNGHDWTQFGPLGIWPLAGALLVGGPLRRRIAAPALALLVVLSQRPGISTGHTSEALGDVVRSALPELAVTGAAVAWVLLAPRAAALWRRALRRGPGLQPTAQPAR